MSSRVPIRTSNAAWPATKARLSVLVPFLRDDPCILIAALGQQTLVRSGEVELVLFDDGTNDSALTAAVKAAIHACALPTLLVSSPINLGRSKGRNQLVQAARAEWFLFLDGDMLPDGPDFLQTYLDMVEASAPAVVFGGFSLLQAPPLPEHDLHRSMALASDCASIEQRQQYPEKYVFTSNLLVRRDVLDQERFDEGFEGWGWEDVEWAMRVIRRHPIIHVSNPATHLGLDPPWLMARKYEQSAANFGRLVRDHLHIVERYPTYKMARILKRFPLRGVWRPCLKGLALLEGAPLRLRALAMRLYRSALYAETV